MQSIVHFLRKFLFLYLFTFLLAGVSICYALPFNVVPTEGTTLPTQVIIGIPVTASYTVTNNTLSPRANNYVKYLPPNVTQLTSGGPNTCGQTFDLAANGQPGDSCILRLSIAGAVNANDPDPHNHLFVCFPAGLTCAGTRYPLNVTALTLISISVIPSTSEVFIGDTVQYTALANYSNGTSDDVTTTLTWSSSDTSVATISATGLATTVGQGTTTITATNSGLNISGTATLTVQPIVLQTIAITPATSDINASQTVQYIATGTYSDGSVVDISSTATWTSSETSVATIDANGLATGVGSGTTTITATLDGVASNSSTLQVDNPVVSIAVTPDPASINKTDTQAFTATGTFFNGSMMDITNMVTWSSSDDSIATITTSGVATGTGVGTAIITASMDGVSSNGAELTVSNPLQSILVQPTSATIDPGETQQYTATGTYYDGSTAVITNSVTWNSSDTGVANISVTGLATANNPGTTTITASSGPITSNNATLTVSNPLVSITLTPNPANVTTGGTLQMTATGTYYDSSTADLTNSATWTSSDTTIATISSAGLATGVAVGTTNITAADEGITSTAVVLNVKSFLYVVNRTPDTISYCTVTSTGNVTGCSTHAADPNIPNPGFITVDHKGTHAYISAEPPTNEMTLCDINLTSGDLENCGPTSNVLLNQPSSLAINPSNTFAYIISTGTPGIYRCEINSTTGALGNCALQAGTNFASMVGAVVNPAGTFIYITSSVANAVIKCNIDQTSGALSTCVNAGPSAAPFPDNPEGITINPAGTYAFIANYGASQILSCAIDQNTGILSDCAGLAPIGGMSPRGVTISALSRLYFSNYDDATVSNCRANSDGTLTDCISYGGFTTPYGIAVS